MALLLPHLELVPLQQSLVCPSQILSLHDCLQRWLQNTVLITSLPFLRQHFGSPLTQLWPANSPFHLCPLHAALQLEFAAFISLLTPPNLGPRCYPCLSPPSSSRAPSSGWLPPISFHNQLRYQHPQVLSTNRKVLQDTFKFSSSHVLKRRNWLN